MAVVLRPHVAGYSHMRSHMSPPHVVLHVALLVVEQSDRHKTRPLVVEQSGQCARALKPYREPSISFDAYE